MTTPGNLDVEAFQTMMRAWVDELSTKQTENLNARIDGVYWETGYQKEKDFSRGETPRPR